MNLKEIEKSARLVGVAVGLAGSIRRVPTRARYYLDVSRIETEDTKIVFKDSPYEELDTTRFNSQGVLMSIINGRLDTVRNTGQLILPYIHTETQPQNPEIKRMSAKTELIMSPVKGIALYRQALMAAHIDQTSFDAVIRGLAYAQRDLLNNCATVPLPPFAGVRNDSESWQQFLAEAIRV